jgi:hypothetical protein
MYILANCKYSVRSAKRTGGVQFTTRQLSNGAKLIGVGGYHCRADARL